MRYALLICQDQKNVITPEEQSARITAFTGFEDQMLARGVLRDRGLRLQPATTATRVQVREGDVVIADGPFAETKEQVGGLYVVECEDLDEAIEVASKIPGAQYGTIEVRPVWER
jgi:hypothetical protein